MTRGSLAAACLALLLPRAPGIAADDESTSFVTAAQASLRASPVDARAVDVNANDGRYIAFVSFARLAPGDTDDDSDIYVLDRVTREISLETPAAERPVHGLDYTTPRLSGDGRLLVYEMAGGAADAGRSLVLRDRTAGTSRRIERPGEIANGSFRDGVISADGRSVVFTSAATNLTAEPDANGSADDVYRFDVASAAISRVSVDTPGRQAVAGSSFAPAVSADGRYVAFSSTAPLDGPVAPQRGLRPMVSVYLRDLALSATIRVSARPGGALPNASSYDASISGDGRFVAFVSEASDLVRGDANQCPDIFIFDAKQKTIELVSRSQTGGSANGSSTHPAMAVAGTVIAFQSTASDLVCGRRCPPDIRDINLVTDIFVFDRRARATRRVSTGRASWTEPSIGPALDGIGAVVAFSSKHPRDSRDQGDDYDLFVRLPAK